MATGLVCAQNAFENAFECPPLYRCYHGPPELFTTLYKVLVYASLCSLRPNAAGWISYTGDVESCDLRARSNALPCCSRLRLQHRREQQQHNLCSSRRRRNGCHASANSDAGSLATSCSHSPSSLDAPKPSSSSPGVQRHHSRLTCHVSYRKGCMIEEAEVCSSRLHVPVPHSIRFC